MSTLEKEIQALKMKLSRMNQRFTQETTEVFERIELLEKLTKPSAEEISGVDAAQILSPAAQMMLNKTAARRGYRK